MWDGEERRLDIFFERGVEDLRFEGTGMYSRYPGLELRIIILSTLLQRAKVRRRCVHYM